MKNFRFMLLTALMMICATANAQSYNAGWNEFTFDIGYGNTYYDGSGSSSHEDITTLSFNYARGIHLTRSNGLTLRPGVGILYGYQDANGAETNFLSVTPKVDFGYHVVWPNSSISIFPYVGLTTRINAWGEIDYNGHKYDLFDSDEGNANRFQVGGRIGFDVHFNKFVLGLTYEHDFSEITEDVKMWTCNVKIGWTFGH